MQACEAAAKRGPLRLGSEPSEKLSYAFRGTLQLRNSPRVTAVHSTHTSSCLVGGTPLQSSLRPEAEPRVCSTSRSSSRAWTHPTQQPRSPRPRRARCSGRPAGAASRPPAPRLGRPPPPNRAARLRSGKSSMLFQYALQVALGGGRVVFISSSDATQQRRPLLPASLDEDEAGEAFGRIGLRYISTKHELQMFFASLASPPDLLIIDAWSDIVPCATCNLHSPPFSLRFRRSPCSRAPACRPSGTRPRRTRSSRPWRSSRTPRRRAARPAMTRARARRRRCAWWRARRRRRRRCRGGRSARSRCS